MTREEWIKYHDEHAKRHKENELFREKECREIFNQEHGLFQYVLTTNNEMVMLECIGHLFYWAELMPKIAKSFNCTKMISFSNTDKPQRLERLYKAKAVSCTDGEWRFEREV